MSVNKVNQTTGALSPIAGGTLFADAPVGSIQAYGGATAPWGWLLCQGQAVSRATYAELFGVIGTNFGAGDGSTTFNIPDLRGNVAVGLNSSDTDFDTIGESGGEKTHRLTQAEMPAHSHSFTGGWGSGNTYAERFSYGSVANRNDSYGIGSTGGNQAHNNLQPYVVTNYIIKATTISLPTDFADAVDDKIADNIVDSITDGNMKAATSNAVYDAIASSTTNSIADGNTKAITSNAIYNQILTEIRSYGDRYYTEKTNITFVADVAQNITHTINNLPAGRYMVFYKVWNGESSRFKLYNYTEEQGTWEGTWSGTNYKFVGVIANHSGGNYSRITNWKQLEENNTIASIGMLLVKIGSHVSN